MKTSVQEMKGRHLRWILLIERISFGESAWDTKQLSRYKGLVVEIDGLVAGYALYKPRTKSISLPRIAVAPDQRRRGLGTKLIETIVPSLSLNGLTRIETAIEAENDPAHLFLRSCDFRAFQIITNKNGKEYYLFEYALPGCETPFYYHCRQKKQYQSRPSHPTNRISQYLHNEQKEGAD